jgi:hypothetical protein
VAGYATIPLQLGWQAANNPSQTQRAVALGMLNTIGQLGSLLGSFSFPSHEGPQYHRGVAVNLSFQALGAGMAVAMSFYYKYENRRRDQKEGGKPTSGAKLDVLVDYDRAIGALDHEHSYGSLLTCLTVHRLPLCAVGRGYQIEDIGY